MFRIEDNKLTLDLPKKLTTRQRITIAFIATRSSDGRELLAYIRSFSGHRVDLYTTFQRLKASGRDRLIDKQPGSVFERYKQRRGLFKNSSPTPTLIENGQAIGVEIECVVPLEREELELEFLKFKVPYVSGGFDGSVHPTVSQEENGFHGYEFRILTKSNDLSNLKAFCEFLKHVEARVNSTCGLHIHLDCRNFERIPSGVVTRLKNALPMLCAMVPQSRLTNAYCISDVSGGRRRSSRYSKINRCAFSKQKTIEVRLHSGTTDFEKISNWIAVLHSIAFSNKRLPKQVAGISGETFVNSYASKLSWTDSVRAYVLARVNRFAPRYLTALIERPVNSDGHDTHTTGIAAENE